MSAINSCLKSDCHKVTLSVNLLIFAGAATITALALSIIVGNHMKATFTTMYMDHVSLLKPEALAFVWSVAKWSGIVSLSSLTVAAAQGMGLFCSEW